MALRGKDRIEEEKAFIQKANRITVTEMTEKWGITSETARRDLDKIESEGLVTRTHGGAVWNKVERNENVKFLERREKNADEKHIIAMNASKLIREFRTIVAGSSSTVVEALREVADDPNILVVTNSSIIFNYLSDARFNIIATGGAFNSNSMSFQGELAKEALRRYNVKLTLISCKGLCRNEGIFDSYESEAGIKKVMLERGEKVALLADHTKFDKTAFIKLSDFEKIDYLITDRKPDDAWIKFCMDNNVELIY